MKRRVALCITFLSALLGPSGASGAPSSKPTVEHGDGCVRTAAEQACSPLEAGGAIPGGNEVVAGQGGALVRFSDGSTIELDAGATVRAGTTMSVPIGPGGAVKAQYVTLSVGKLHARVPAGTKPRAAVMVRGPHQTQVIVTSEAIVRAKGETLAVANLAGKMLATSSKDWSDVPPLKVRTLSRDEGKPQLRDMLPAPGVGPSRQVTSTVADGGELLRVAWLPVPGASLYEVRVVRVGEKGVTRLVAQGSDLGVTLGKLPPGQYEARVRAYDADEIAGAESAGIPMTVVGVTLPAGAFVAGPGLVQLSDGQQIELSPVDGLEAADDVGHDFAPAPASLAMRGGQGRVLRLRRKGGTVESKIRIEARTLGVDVELGPKRARWPQDSINVTVRLVNRAGGAVPSDVKLVPEVTLGLRPLDVSWKQESPALLRAIIPPQPVSGPTVVRVEVKDQYGLFLGRNFLEIEAPAPAGPAKK
jgi:hypothetical protein